MILGSWCAAGCRESEPSYLGRSLSFWMATLDSPSSDARAHAIEAIAMMNPPASQVLPALSEKLWDESPPVRANAAAALALVGQHGKQNVPRLIELLDDSDGMVRAAQPKL